MFLFSMLFGVVVLYWLWVQNSLPLGLWFTGWVEVDPLFARTAAVLIAGEMLVNGAIRLEVITNELLQRWSGIALLGMAIISILIGIVVALLKRANYSESKEFYQQIVDSVEKDKRDSYHG